MKRAFVYSLPVMIVYLSLGIAYGILMEANGYNALWSFFTSVFVFAGAAQYAMVGLLVSLTNPLSVFLIILILNARHLFYGISMMKKYDDLGHVKWYLMLGLTDETFGIVQPIDPKTLDNPKRFYLLTTLFNHGYWVVGSTLGGILGSLITIDILGLDFILTALFVSVFVSQAKKKDLIIPTTIGLVVSFGALLIFKEQFILPSMVLIVLSLLILASKRGVILNGK